MGFHIWPMALVNPIIATVGALRRESAGIPPKTLSHYTSSPAVVAITEQRHVRAHCVTGLLDKTEVIHGTRLIDAKAEKTIGCGTTPFASMVLTRLSEQLERGIDRTFVLCFCASSNSLFHWRVGKFGFGDYSLQFETGVTPEPLLRPQSGGASVQYNRVIYSRSRQRHAIRKAIAATVTAIESSTGGTPEGPRMESTAAMVARNVSELLLDLIVSFKRRYYALEQEWRLVVRPDATPFSSAPEMADENFDVMVKTDAKTFKRYVELSAPYSNKIFGVPSPPPVPFTSVIESPFLRSRAERESIRRSLEENGRPDIAIHKAWYPS